jgi:hypothetical protein
MKIFLIIILLLTTNAVSASVIINTCKTIAGSAKQIAIMKKQGVTEESIREAIFDKNINLKKENDPNIPKSFIDAVTEGEIEILIFLFNAKNRALTPDQVYSIKFDECFKDLKSKGF